MDPRVTDARNEAWREIEDIDYGILRYTEDRDDFLRKDIPDYMGRLERVTAMDPSEITQEVADDILSKVYLPGQHGMRNRDYLKREIETNSMKPQLGLGDPDPAGVVHKRVLTTVLQDALTYIKQQAQVYNEEIASLREEREKLLAPFNLLPTNKGTNKRSGGRNEGGLQGMGVPDHMRRGEMWQAGLNRRS
jgi:hypothetical protein